MPGPYHASTLANAPMTAVPHCAWSTPEGASAGARRSPHGPDGLRGQACPAPERCLTDSDIALLVDWHLRACGATRAVFEPDAVTILFQHSRGLPRLVQGLDLGALMAAASGSMKTVGADSVQQALLDMEAA